VVTRPRVYITRRIPQEALHIVARHCDFEVWDRDEPVDPAVLAEKIREVDGLLTLLTDAVTEDLLARARRLRVIAQMAVGYDNIDVEAATRRGIVVTNTPGVLTESTADLAFALLLAAARQLPQAERSLREGRWTTWRPMEFTGQDVHGAVLGIIGLGRIGAAVARRAAGFGMQVIYYSRSRKLDLEAALGCRYVDLPTLLGEADFVSIHCPLTPETHHLIGEPELRRMKPTAVLINTARGAIVDEAALVRALREGWIWAAGLDVYHREPLPADHPLLGLERVVALPHIGSASIRTRTRMACLAAENLVAVLTGQRPPTPVNWTDPAP